MLVIAHALPRYAFVEDISEGFAMEQLQLGKEEKSETLERYRADTHKWRVVVLKVDILRCLEAVCQHNIGPIKKLVGLRAGSIVKVLKLSELDDADLVWKGGEEVIRSNDVEADIIRAP